jgi:hypothetical protein
LECQIWQDWYDSSNGPNWKYWTQNRNDPCACSVKSANKNGEIRISGGHITYFWMSNNNASGTIPAVFSKLLNTTGFDMGGNSLTGAIPAEVNNMSSLFEIKLRGNKLTGSIPDLRQLFNVHGTGYVDLGNNMLSLVGDIEKWFPPNCSICRLANNAFLCPIPRSVQQVCGVIASDCLSAPSITAVNTTSTGCSITVEFQAGTSPFAYPSTFRVSLRRSASEHQQVLTIPAASSQRSVQFSGLSGGQYQIGVTAYHGDRGWLSALTSRGTVGNATTVPASCSHLPAPPNHPGPSAPFYAVVGGLVCLAMAAAAAVSQQRQRGKKRRDSLLDKPLMMTMGEEHGDDTELTHIRDTAEFDVDTGAPLNAEAKQLCVLQWCAGEAGSVRELPYAHVAAAAGGFGAENRLSGGGSCTVFKGELYGLAVAVKQLHSDADDWNNAQFEAEMQALFQISHEHICGLHAFSTDGPQRCLVLELCSGGSLESRLACVAVGQGPVPEPLGWRHRVAIALGIAQALKHLHSLRPQMLHRDMKASALPLPLHVGCHH